VGARVASSYPAGLGHLSAFLCLERATIGRQGRAEGLGIAAEFGYRKKDPLW